MASPHTIERQRGAKEASQQLGVLRERWPLAFPAKPHDVRPLALGTVGQIAEAMGWSVPYTIGVLTYWKMAPVYCQAVLLHDQRITLDGAPAEAVDAEAKELRFVRPAPTLCRARPARPVLRSSVQVPCNHSCEAIAPVRLISVHRRRNLNGDSLMHTVDRGREWPYFDVSHCSTLQSGGSAVRPDAASGRTQRLRVTGGFRVPPKRGHNQQERGP
jgi:hypothetical protein